MNVYVRVKSRITNATGQSFVGSKLRSRSDESMWKQVWRTEIRPGGFYLLFATLDFLGPSTMPADDCPARFFFLQPKFWVFVALFLFCFFFVSFLPCHDPRLAWSSMMPWQARGTLALLRRFSNTKQTNGALTDEPLNQVVFF